jgi:hypothetical protein
MTTRSTLVQGAPAGAGRSWEWVWPDWGLVWNDNAVPPGTSGSRGGPVSQAGATGVSVAATGAVRVKNYQPGTGVIATAFNGADCIQFLNGAAGDLADLKGPGVHPAIDQLAAGVVADPFERVMRYVGVCAFPALGGALGAAADLGLELRPGNVASMNNGANRPGVMFGPIDANTIAFRGRATFAAAYTFNEQFTLAQLGLASYDTWLVWELRVISADATGPAQLKAFLNGRQFGTTKLFGSGAALLPGPSAAGGGFQGLYPCFMNTNTGAYSAYVRRLRVITAPDEQSV